MTRYWSMSALPQIRYQYKLEPQFDMNEGQGTPLGKDSPGY
jgi:hypothetical protein